MAEEETSDLEIQETKGLFSMIDNDIKKNHGEWYFFTVLTTSQEVKNLLVMGSYAFLRLGEYLLNAEIDYPKRKEFWVMLINAICAKECIREKPSTFSSFDVWVEWLCHKYPHQPQ